MTKLERPDLQVYQSLWAMQPHSPEGVKLPLEEVCDMVAAEGFSGMAIDLGAADVQTAHDVRPHLERNNLTPLIVAFPKTVEVLARHPENVEGFRLTLCRHYRPGVSAIGRRRYPGHSQVD